jgi:phosphatidylglycerol:prolipoprotein diacylglycerol transferase
MFPISIDLGFRFLPFYEGLYFLIAIASAAAWALRRWKRSGLAHDSFDVILMAGLFSAIFGARASHFLFWDLELLASDPLAFFRVWEGGLSVSGGVVCGVLGAYVACRVRKIDFWKVMEVASPTVLLGQAVGRVGCFLNGDAFGLPSNLPWAVGFRRFATVLPSFKADTRYSSFAWSWCAQRRLVDLNSEYSLPMHPTQLYEGALDMVLLALLLLAMRRLDEGRRGKFGLLALIGGYSLIRFCMEFLRADHDSAFFLGMTGFQLSLLGAFAASLIALPFALKAKRA